MNFSTRVTELLGIRYPIIQAGMIDELLPAADVVARLLAEFEGAVERLSRFRG